MTTIKKLRMQGFKSFPKSTDVTFPQGFSVVLGPNGSGKSNLGDGLMFVLGSLSPKSLRVENAASLIYNGGKQNQAAKYAQVDLHFDNTSQAFPLKESEVKITRIIKSSGQSTYKINNQRMTRQQIREVLGAAAIDPDGHNIILQGDIAKFIEMRPEERREVIEEVSGLSTYEDKKAKSLQELRKVDEKIKEANIILTERKAHLAELKNDRDIAVQYKKLEERIKQNKATALHLQLVQKKKHRSEIEERLGNHQKKIAMNVQKLQQWKKDLDNIQQNITQIQADMKEKGATGQEGVQQQIDAVKDGLSKINARQEIIRQELTKMTERKPQLAATLQEGKRKITQLQKELQQLQQQKVKLAVTEEKLLKAAPTQNIDHLQKKLFELQASLNQNLREHDRVMLQIEHVKEQWKGIQGTDIQKLQADVKEVVQILGKSTKQEAELTAEIQDNFQRLQAQKEKIAALNTRSIMLRERPNERTINAVITSGIPGMHNTIAELIRVPEKYTLAAEVAAGSRIDSIVVDTEVVAEKCINFLKSQKLGVLRFLPLNKLRASLLPSQPHYPGIHGFLINLVSTDNQYKSAIAYVFGSTLVIDSITIAQKVGYGKLRMVTLQGDIIEVSGAMIGGYRHRIASIFKDKNLERTLSELQAAIQQLEQDTKQAQQKRMKIQTERDSLRTRKAEIDAEIMKIEKLTGQTSATQLQDNLISLQDKGTALTKIIQSQESKMQQQEKRIQQVREKQENANLTKVQQNIAECDRKSRNLQLQITDIYGREQERIQHILKLQEKELKSFKEELAQLVNEKKNKQLMKNKLLKQYKEYKTKFQSLIKKREKLHLLFQRKETTIVRMEEQIRALEERGHTMDLDKAKITAEITGLETEFNEFAAILVRKNITLEEVKYDLQRCERDLTKMGNVNLRSLEIYEQLEEEYQDLQDKSKKLDSEKEDVLQMMKEIEAKKKSLFMKTFRNVSQNFTAIYAQLASKGTAYLELENTQDPFSAGLLMKVKLTPGKILSLKSLSGGEKTLTALAFIFAIQDYNPASFYLLDEVDAALDKTNSEKLSKLISQYSKKAQYIVISHNDQVISEADQVYGVSMQQGVSKIMSLKL